MFTVQVLRLITNPWQVHKVKYLPPTKVTYSHAGFHNSGGLRQALVQESITQTTNLRKFMAYSADLKCTTGYCFASYYCIVVDDTNKLVSMEMPCPLVNNV